MQQAITEIVYRALAKVGAEHALTDANKIAVIGDAISNHIAELITVQHDHSYVYRFWAKDLDTFLLFSALMDEIQKTIPVVERYDVCLKGPIYRIKSGKYAARRDDAPAS